jgi:DMSO/TMAO reductase YedYZ molybdopterin-dependent catalytic subunit
MSASYSYKAHGFFGRIPCEPHSLIERVTPTRDCIVLCHMGVLGVEHGDAWELEIGGMVARPARFTVHQIKAMPKTVVMSVHQCAGSPLDPDKPTQRVCNVIWAGVRLDHVLGLIEPDAGASFVWSIGADSGEFGGVACGNYAKDLPLWRATNDVLLAYEMNGEPLLPEHGFPLRLVAPGFYGTNSVKWLRRIELRSERAPGPFTTTWYNDAMSDGSTKPVWAIAPQSVIVRPAPGTTLKRGAAIHVWGWAWADEGLSAVEISFDCGRTWKECRVESATDHHAWCKFACDCTLEDSYQNVTSRATSRSGDRQPEGGRRNGLYHVPLVID